MLPEIDKIRGIHPGDILRRELKIRGLKSSELVEKTNEHKQTISAVLNKRRKITPLLSVKLADTFSVSHDYFLLLQASYDVSQIVARLKKDRPNLEIIRSVLFWDTDINNIDWNKQKRAVIQRVLERGNDLEIEEIIGFYGLEVVKAEVQKIHGNVLPSFKENVIKYKL